MLLHYDDPKEVRQDYKTMLNAIKYAVGQAINDGDKLLFLCLSLLCMLAAAHPEQSVTTSETYNVAVKVAQ